eukprot:m.11944 g.11944  ORF g.11944 m.11944 type:complete len:217 (-) comp7089_c0_seq1:36-686(-)
MLSFSSSFFSSLCARRTSSSSLVALPSILRQRPFSTTKRFLVATKHSIVKVNTPIVTTNLRSLRPRQLPSQFSPSLRSFHKNNRTNLHNQQPRRNMSLKSFYKEWTAPKPDPERYSKMWWTVWTIRFVVFAITGSSSVKFVRPLMESWLGITGSWTEGPASFYIASFAFVTPIYTVILLTVGTLFGQQPYFLQIASRMWSRILPFLFKNTKKPHKK